MCVNMDPTKYINGLRLRLSFGDLSERKISGFYCCSPNTSVLSIVSPDSFKCQSFPAACQLLILLSFIRVIFLT